MNSALWDAGLCLKALTASERLKMTPLCHRRPLPTGILSSPAKFGLGHDVRILYSRPSMGMNSKLMSGQITLFRVFISARSPVI